MADRDSTNDVTSMVTDEDEQILAHFNNPEPLANLLLKTVGEWTEEDADIFSVAAAGEAYAEEREEHIEASLFHVIQSYKESTGHAKFLAAGIRKLAALCEASNG